jgi:aspartate carbamoyltransferase catalytic subunit
LHKAVLKIQFRAQFADTMRTIESYADVIVMRHSVAGSAKRAAQALSIPLINAGDGPGQHPTQVRCFT